MDVWDFYGTIQCESDRESLTPTQQAIAAICDLRQDVNAGGFDSYFRYWGGNTANEALASIGTLLGGPWADLLHEAMNLIGQPYPDSIDEREQALDDDGIEERLDSLDARFYDLEASVDADAILSDQLETSR